MDSRCSAADVDSFDGVSPMTLALIEKYRPPCMNNAPGKDCWRRGGEGGGRKGGSKREMCSRAAKGEKSRQP